MCNNNNIILNNNIQQHSKTNMSWKNIFSTIQATTIKNAIFHTVHNHSIKYVEKNTSSKIKIKSMVLECIVFI